MGEVYGPGAAEYNPEDTDDVRSPEPESGYTSQPTKPAVDNPFLEDDARVAPGDNAGTEDDESAKDSGDVGVAHQPYVQDSGGRVGAATPTDPNTMPSSGGTSGPAESPQQ
jgi:hypothetical protein